jgi:hypothetical protein
MVSQPVQVMSQCFKDHLERMHHTSGMYSKKVSNCCRGKLVLGCRRDLDCAIIVLSSALWATAYRAGHCNRCRLSKAKPLMRPSTNVVKPYLLTRSSMSLLHDSGCVNEAGLGLGVGGHLSQPVTRIVTALTVILTYSATRAMLAIIPLGIYFAPQAVQPIAP